MVENSEKALAMKILRHIVETQAWDYCVVWKLGDDPTRFIEWMDCCCGGHVSVNVKQEEGMENEKSLQLCRDTYYEHPLRTRACKSLAHFPSSLPLYNGIHGDVVISKNPAWVCHSGVPDSALANESKGTRVLIPVAGGLVELYAAKHMPKDQKTLDYIMAQCSLEQEFASIAQSQSSLSFNEPLMVQSFYECFPDLQPSLHYRNCIYTFDASSSGSNPCHENSSLASGSCHLSPVVKLNPSFALSPLCDENFPLRELGQFLGNDTISNKKQSAKAVQKSGKDNYKSKNLKLERNRRKNIKDGLFALRALVPKISKMDRVSILTDAIAFIEELKSQETSLQDELKSMEYDCNKESYHEADRGRGRMHSEATEDRQGSSSYDEKKRVEVSVDVTRIGMRNFMLEVVSEEQRGGFTRLMETIDSFGLQVEAANVTTCGGMVLNILKVETQKELVHAKILKESLMKVAGKVEVREAVRSK